MKNNTSLLSAVIMMVSVPFFAQNSFQSMNNTMTMQRQQMSVARESQRLGQSMTSNHSKFIIPRQKEIDLFNRLLVKNQQRTIELEAELEEKKIELETSDNKEKIQKQIQRKENWLNVLRNEKKKFERAISKLEGEIAASEKNTK
ncbi:hypothetical protein CHRY9390_02755 [Chryseobacterium aquaeductus]|uniref:Uncharacterized protein n=1 Tax=Chryseobacterium aquaeductus TaxID=2675056 RepID=A0A9N8MHS0_9FLAO|nr:hypothetical protein [Chryseobacterium aquaeductus]CAA7332034.1 hypothetical protein CHRY9390_02755 [Chryseobacterium potabilaquae]CAD7814098.1 hypothetical protein CHRY9390_02755 [Chryseobacterium aquaeductus]